MGVKLDLADIKPSVLSALLFVAYALLLIPLTKYFFTKYNVPGLSDLARAI